MVESPVIKIAGVAYTVPKLVPRQQRYVLPALLRVTPAMYKLGKAMKEQGGLANLENPLTTEIYEDLLRILYWGVIWPNDKAFKYDTIYDLPIDLEDLSTAALAVQKQSGLFRQASVEEAESGEDQAAK